MPASHVGNGRERTITEAFVAIADALVDGHDIMDLYGALTSDCARILDVASAGLLLADDRGVLQVMAASSEATRTLELFLLQAEEGPCLDCFRTGAPVSAPDLSKARARWPRFVPAAAVGGIVSVHAVPMRLRDTLLGTLGLFGDRPGALKDDDLSVAQALAHVASVALVAGRAASDKTVINSQLQMALNSRVTLEQAKGVLAQLGSLDMEQSFAVLRRYSRDHNRKLVDIARAVVARDLPASLLLDHARAKGLIGAPEPETATT